VVYFSPGQERDLTLVTSTGDWQQIPNDVVYWRVDGGLCVAAEKNLVLIVECVGKAGLKPGLSVLPLRRAKIGVSSL